MRYKNIKKKNIGIFPTPLYKLENISKELQCNIFIKRDDLTGIGFGGNKVRKLEYLLNDALLESATTLLTYGDIQTNHGMLTAAVAAKAGLKSIIVATLYENLPEKLSGNLLLDKILNCDVIFMDARDIVKDSENKSIEQINQEILELRNSTTKKIIDEYEAKGEKVYVIPSGGSSPLGTLGYVNAVKEILSQLEEKNEKIDYVVCGQGSKGTFSGLWLGSKYYNAPFEVLGVDIEFTPNNIKSTLANFINKISTTYEMGIKCFSEDLYLTDDFVEKGYAIPDDKTYKVIYKLARAEGIFVDPVYTAKIFHGVIGLIKSGKIKKNSNILFIHSGGLPGIFNEENIEFFSKKLWKGKEHKIMK